MHDDDDYLYLEEDLTEYDSYITYEQKVRSILKKMESDFNNDSNLVCQQLPGVWEMHKKTIKATADLYEIYLNLRRLC